MPNKTPFRKRPIPQASRRALALKSGGIPGEKVTVPCHYCGTPGTISWPTLYLSGRPGAWVHFSHDIDHVIPESRGGSSDAENLVLACAHCNRSKGAR